MVSLYFTMASIHTASGSGKELASESGVGRVVLGLGAALERGKPEDEVLGLQADQEARC